MIVPDGRTDGEKLRELLAASEETHLDFKSTVDLSVTEDRLKFVKDAVAMSNRPEGGYILVGVDDAGEPCLPVGTVDRKAFDGANLGGQVRSYIEGQIHIYSAVHEVDGHEVVLIYVRPHEDGLPVPMSSNGQYQKDGDRRPTVVFREGEVLVREGTANVPLRYSHWRTLLTRHDAQVREEARTSAEALMAAFVRESRSDGEALAAGGRPAPLLLEQNEDTFSEAVLTHLESGSDVGIRQFLSRAKNVISSSTAPDAEVAAALDKTTIVAAQAVFCERTSEAKQAVDCLYEAYMHGNTGPEVTRRRLDIVTRVYALGSLAVRMRTWTLIPNLVQRPVELPAGNPYIYATWLRHGQVEASRAELFPPNRGGLAISMARELAAEHPGMRPDVGNEALAPAEALNQDDALLNSLCQFDLLYCLMVAAEGQGQGGWNPACSALHQSRVDPIIDLVASNESLRRQLFRTADDEVVAAALAEVYRTAKQESHRYGGNWWSLNPVSAHFVTSNAHDQ